MYIHTYIYIYIFGDGEEPVHGAEAVRGAELQYGPRPHHADEAVEQQRLVVLGYSLQGGAVGGGCSGLG